MNVPGRLLLESPIACRRSICLYSFRIGPNRTVQTGLDEVTHQQSRKLGRVRNPSSRAVRGCRLYPEMTLIRPSMLRALPLADSIEHRLRAMPPAAYRPSVAMRSCLRAIALSRFHILVWTPRTRDRSQ